MTTNREPVLEISNVRKKFSRSLKRSLYYGMKDITQEMMGLTSNPELRPSEFWALDDVSLRLYPGESLGLVGVNGSGKTTLLKVICGLIKPDSGVVKFTGRIAPLIALGPGFNPILSGFENIYANMTILGHSKSEIDKKLDDIIAFAEIGTALEAPVQTYSSGMVARLGFACAIHTDPDILLIDEILAVGDMKFRIKCYRKLNELKENGTSFVYVSHSSSSIVSVCERAIFLKQGRMISEGNSQEIIRRYEEDLFAKTDVAITGQMALGNNAQRELGIQKIFFRSAASGEVVEDPKSGDPTILCVAVDAKHPISNVCANITISDLAGDGSPQLQLSSSVDNRRFNVPQGRSEIQLAFPNLGLKGGFYFIKMNLVQNKLNFLDAIEAFHFRVLETEFGLANRFYQARSWSILSP